MSEASLFAKIGIGAVVLLALALVGKLWLGLLLLAAYCLWRGRKPILAAINSATKE